MILILSALSVEEETLSCLGGMCGIGMRDVLGLLIAEVSGKVSMFEGCIAKPEVLLREDKTPK